MITALAFMSACGSGNNNNNNPAPPPAPRIDPYNPNNTNQGCVGGVNTQSTFVYFGGSYDVIREQYLPSYQCLYGSMTLSSSVPVGSKTIAAGTYSWQQMYDQITSALRSCSVFSSNSGVDVGIWASANFGYFSGSYSSNPRVGTCNIGNTDVRFQRPNSSSDFMQVMMAIAQLNSTYYYSLDRYGGGYAPSYYGPSGGIIGNGTNVFGGLSYNSGSGLNFNLGGAFGF